VILGRTSALLLAMVVLLLTVPVDQSKLSSE
jgi:hypothetical protein